MHLKVVAGSLADHIEVVHKRERDRERCAEGVRGLRNARRLILIPGHETRAADTLRLEVSVKQDVSRIANRELEEHVQRTADFDELARPSIGARDEWEDVDRYLRVGLGGNCRETGTLTIGSRCCRTRVTCGQRHSRKDEQRNVFHGSPQDDKSRRQRELGTPRVGRVRAQRFKREAMGGMDLGISLRFRQRVSRGLVRNRDGLGNAQAHASIASGLDGLVLRGRWSRHSASEERCGVAASMYPQLVQYVVNVVLDRGDLHAEFPSDFLVTEPIVNEPYNLALPVTEMGLPEARVRPASERRNPPQQHRRDPGGTGNFTPSDARQDCEKFS